MAYDYLGITNLVIARFNEVALTSAGFTSARGFQTQCKNAVNDSINYINQREFGWGFNHDTQTTTLVPGTIRYSIPTNAKHVDYETFRVSKDSDLGTAGGALTVMDYKEYLELHVTQEDDVTATLLDGSLNSSATTITVDSTTGFSSTGTLYIESEQITYTGTSSTTFTGCTRGANSTTAASHSDDVRVAQFDSGATPRHVVRTADNNFLLFPYPDKAYELKFEFFKIPTTLSAATDVPAIPVSLTLASPLTDSVPNAVVPATPVSVTLASPVTVSLPIAPVAVTPVSDTLASAVTDSVPKAVVPAKPVSATLAAPVATTEPTAPVAATPISGTLASHDIVSVPSADVPATPVILTETLTIAG